MVSVDAYNLFNINTITTYNNAFASWQAPVAIQQARFAKFSVQFDF